MCVCGVCGCGCVVEDCEGLLEAQVGEGRYVHLLLSPSLPTLKWYCLLRAHACKASHLTAFCV